MVSSVYTHNVYPYPPYCDGAVLLLPPCHLWYADDKALAALAAACPTLPAMVLLAEF